MPVQTKQQDDKKVKDDTVAVGVPGVASKELEPQRVEEKRLLDEVVEASEKHDLEAEKKLQESLGAEARLSVPDLEIPPDVEDSGVVSPQKEASKIAADGSTIDLPIMESGYREGERVKVGGSVVNKEIVGVPSVVAFVMFVGRIIKMAHRHMKKVVFRKEN